MGDTGSEQIAALRHWARGQFVPVVEYGDAANTPPDTRYDPPCYYGGYQSWLENVGVSHFIAERSCGVTAAANMLCYLAGEEGRFAPLCPIARKGAAMNVPVSPNGTDSGATAGPAIRRTQELPPVALMSKSEFSSFQMDLFRLLRPWVWGVPSAFWFGALLRKYARQRGVDLRPVRRRGRWGPDNVRSYIMEGLGKNRPVLLLTWNSPIKEMRYHWVTVTKMWREVKTTAPGDYAHTFGPGDGENHAPRPDVGGDGALGGKNAPGGGHKGPAADEGKGGTWKILVSTWGGMMELDFDRWMGTFSFCKRAVYFDG
ncbi:MAG: hypothetical protein LBR77_11780 [Lachnospiraceae bacterium]|jgi:hypothetical protein|nr:hypothetical protein [Lachnospiraceae bacterium]